MRNKLILCLDFDGVLHSYSSGWKGPTVIPDPPVEGAMSFLWGATDYFRVAIFSSRSHHWGGRRAMKIWLRHHFLDYWGTHRAEAEDKLAEIEWPLFKPSAFLTIDDRALQFTGEWPEIAKLQQFKPWNRR